jgi:general secretion pathway protein C
VPEPGDHDRRGLRITPVRAACIAVALVAATMLIAHLAYEGTGETQLASSAPPAIDDGYADLGALPQEMEPREEIEPSDLPLRLLGTMASTDPALSRATVRHLETQRTFVIGVGDEILHARVEGIERERILLREEGSVRELRLEREQGAPAPNDVATAPEAPSEPVPSDTNTETGVVAAQDPMDHFELLVGQLTINLQESTGGQAQLLPEVEDGSLVGLSVGAIQPDSLFAQMGIQNGDVITEIDGVAIDQPLRAMYAVRALLDADTYRVTVRRGGTEQHLDGRFGAVED